MRASPAIAAPSLMLSTCERPTLHCPYACTMCSLHRDEVMCDRARAMVCVVLYVSSAVGWGCLSARPGRVCGVAARMT